MNCSADVYTEEDINEEEEVAAINDFIHSWIEKYFDLDVEVNCAIDFGAYPWDQNDLGLNWTFITGGNSDEDFYEFIEQMLKVNVREFDPWILSLFHEIGHLFTAKNFTKKDKSHYEIRVNFLSTKYSEAETREEQRKINLIYFGLPVEVAATKWAVNYIQANSFLVKDFFEKVTNLIVKYYEKVESEI